MICYTKDSPDLCFSKRKSQSLLPKFMRIQERDLVALCIYLKGQILTPDEIKREPQHRHEQNICGPEQAVIYMYGISKTMNAKQN